ncbi:MAG: ferredoxin, partial [Woeseiaceae bacterium]
LLVDNTMVQSAAERRDFWVMLKGLAETEDDAVVDDVQLESRIRQEVVQKIASGLMGIVSGNQALDLNAMLDSAPAAQPSPDQPPQLVAVETTAPAAETAGEYMAPWIDTEECTTCDECIIINPQIFAYNADNKAFIQNADGGPYRDIVKSAEKCTAQIIHPGLPRDRSAKDMAKWVKRGEKFN